MKPSLPSLRLSLGLVLGCGLLSAPALGQTLPPGEQVIDAAMLDVTPEGFDFLMGEVGNFLPPDLVIGSFPSQEVVDELGCSISAGGENIVVSYSINELAIVPQAGYLDVVANVDIWVNDSADPFLLDLDADGWCSALISQVCQAWVTPYNVQLAMPLVLSVEETDVGPRLQLTVGAVETSDFSTIEANIQIDGCALATFQDLIVGFAVDSLIGEIETQIDDLAATIEEAANPALLDIAFSDTVEVLDRELSIDVVPEGVDHTTDGLRVRLSGGFDAPPDPCVEAYNPDEGSASTPFPPPAGIYPTTPDGDIYHLGVHADDDFINQAAYAAWRGGVLCYEVDELPGLGPLSGGLLSILVGPGSGADEAISAVIDSGAPMVLALSPVQPPAASFGGRNDINLEIRQMGLDFFTQVADRWVRLMTIAIDIDAGVDLSITPAGGLGLAIDLYTDAITAEVTYNEIVPEANAEIETNFPTALVGIIDTIAGDLLGEQQINLPTFSGLGITSVDIVQTGDGSDFLGVFATLGPSDGGDADPSSCDGCGDSGCADAGGCGDSGCGEEGCDVNELLGEAGCSGEAGSDLEAGCSEGCDSSCDVRGPHRHLHDGTVRTWTNRPRRPNGLIANALMMVAAAGLIAHRRRRMGA